MTLSPRLAVLALIASPLAAQTPRGDAEVVRREEPAYAAPSVGASPCGDAEFLRDMQEFRDALKANPAPLQAGAKGPSAPKKSREDGLRAALTAMGDGIEVGGILKGHLDAQGVKVVFAAQAAASTRSSDGKTISLSDALPAAPRVLAPWIAREAAEGLLSAMPASGEREYMRLSYMTRVWLELGGSKGSLPAIETLKDYYHEDAALAAGFKLWLKTYQSPEWGAEEAGKAAKLPTLSELKAKAKSAAEKAKLDEAAKLFKAFTDAEIQWYQLNKGTVDL